MGTRITNVDWGRVKVRDGDAVMLRLAMVVNDIASTHYLLSRVEKDKGELATDVYYGLQVYALKMRLAHLREGMKVIPDILQTNKYNGYLSKLHPDNRRAYEEVKAMLPGGADHDDFKKYILTARNTVASHYDAREATRGMEFLACSGSHGVNSIIDSDNILSSRLVIADAVTISILCDLQWQVTGGTPAEDDEAIDKVCEWTGGKCRAMYGFGRELCESFFRECSSI
jgi:hypothetical protein